MTRVLTPFLVLFLAVVNGLALETVFAKEDTSCPDLMRVLAGVDVASTASPGDATPVLREFIA